MKKLFSFFVLTIMMLVAVACTTQQTTSTVTKAQKIATNVCPPIQSAMKALAGLSLSDTAQANLATATPIVASVCSASPTLDASSMQALASTGIPAISQVVQASPISDQLKQEIGFGLGAASIALAVAISL